MSTITPAGKAADDFTRQLRELGVSDFVIGYRDPDKNVDAIQVTGSLWWRMGLGMEIMEDAKQDRLLSRQEDMEDEE